MPFGNFEFNIGLNTGQVRGYDCLVFAMINVIFDGDRGSIIGQYSNDNGQTWITIAQASVHSYGPSDAHIGKNSFSMAIKAQIPFRIVTEPTHGNPHVSAYLVEVK